MRLRRHIAAASAAAAMIALSAISAAAASTMSLAYSPDASPWSLAPGEYYTELSGSSFAASSYYDAAGDRIGLPGKVQQRAFRSYTELGWKKSLSVQLSMPLVTNTVRGASSSASLTGLEDFAFGLRYKLTNGATASAVQLRWEAPSGYNSKLVVPAGDGRQKLSASLQLGGAAGKGGFWQLGGGYRYDYVAVAGREAGEKIYGEITATDTKHDWADHATFNAAYARWFGKLQVAGLYDGAFHVTTGRDYKVFAQAAGPRFTYRVDERVGAFAGSWHTPSGRNTPHYDEYYAGIAWRSTKLTRLQGFLGGDKRP